MIRRVCKPDLLSNCAWYIRSVSCMNYPILGPCPHGHSEILFFNLCSSSPMCRTESLRRTMIDAATMHDHQSKRHRMLYPLDEPSWSFTRLSKVINSSETKKDCHCWESRSVGLVSLALKVANHYLKLNDWGILSGWCSLSFGWSYCEIRTHDGFLITRRALYLSQVTVCRYNLRLQL